MKKINFFFSILILFSISKLTLSQESWTATSIIDAPTARQLHTSVWTGSKMIIWGGYSGINENTGGLFDPVNNSWVETSTINAPQRRSAHSAVWTGSLMIIWGGTNFNSGCVYNPLTNSWVSTSTINAPSGRSFHRAVWTGNEMIIWGGNTGSEVLNTGGKYNPTSDNWAPTSIINVPDGRYLHSSVWTGNKMIIWGGVNLHGLTYFNSGGIYDPVNDNWMPVSTTNAPSARCSHTAIWTGSKMIIWGGITGIQVYTNTGGIYDPFTDSWSQITVSGAPSARAYHTAIWTGTKMIIWGGIDNNYETNTGGIYNPSTNSWESTTLSNAPESREHHTTVWTGTKMIVWGGMNLGIMMNTGGIYFNPSVIGIQPISSEIPNQFSLSQNYPNPFNPTTKIKFSLPLPSNGGAMNVQLIIYDILGKQIASLIPPLWGGQEGLQPGTYAVEWDASAYSSGVYFYKLSVFDASAPLSITKKMVLLK